jgi:hypothetical protein
LLGTALKSYGSGFESQVIKVRYENESNNLILNPSYFGKKLELNQVIKMLELYENGSIEENTIINLFCLGSVLNTELHERDEKSPKFSNVNQERFTIKDEELRLFIWSYVFLLNKNSKNLFSELQKSRRLGEKDEIVNLYILENEPTKKKNYSDAIKFLNRHNSVLDTSEDVFDNGFRAIIKNASTSERVVKENCFSRFFEFAEFLDQWIGNNQTNDAEEFLNPVPLQNEILTKEHTDSNDIYLSTIDDISELENQTIESDEQLSYLTEQMQIDFDSLCVEYHDDYEQVLDVLQKKYAYNFQLGTSQSFLADSLIQNHEQTKETKQLKTKLEVTWSKKVAAELLNLKINFPVVYKKAFKLFETITKCGGIQGFLHEVKQTNSEVPDFELHSHKTKKNVGIFKVDDTYRVLIHLKTGQVVFVGNPAYHK